MFRGHYSARSSLSYFSLSRERRSLSVADRVSGGAGAPACAARRERQLLRPRGGGQGGRHAPASTAEPTSDLGPVP